MRTALAGMPVFEGLVRPGQAEAAQCLVRGAQALAPSEADADDLQIQAYGRLRFTDAALAAQAQAQGLRAALHAGWYAYGAGLLDHLDGEYLLALWAPRARRGFVAADRFSALPLYYGAHQGRFAWAMQPARVCALLGLAPELDPRALHAYVWFHEIPAPLSILRGVSRLDLGQGVRLEGGSADAFWHWQPRFDEQRPFDFPRERAAFMAALRSGVRECTDGVPREALGCFLSGGTDSSTIAGLTTEAYGAPARTFSIGFDVSAYDESHFARLAARHFGTEHTELILTPDEAERSIDLIAAAYEQPFGNASALPTHVCARLAGQAGIRRMLGGDGGDELYGGNERYATQWLFSLYEHVPAALRSGMLEPLLFGPFKDTGFWPLRKARGYAEQARVPLPDRISAKYNLLNRFGAANVFSDEMLAGMDGFEPLSLEREVWARSAGAQQLNRLLAYDFKFTLGDNDLPKVTRMCHAAGVEVAFPMLTDTLVRHSLQLQPGQKLKGRKLRHFFRESLRGFLPDEIIDKSKHGFGMPFGEWMLSQPRLAARADDALGSLAGRGLIRPGFLDVLRTAIHGEHAGYYGTMTWVLMMLELWLRAHVDEAGIAPLAPRPDPRRTAEQARA